MTPQEHQLVTDLFERLATLEKEPRDPEAERAIRDGLSRAPNALYALVQTSLLQDEALRQAQGRIEELEAALSPPQPAQQQGGGFLDNLRSAMFGGGQGQPQGQGRGSVPSVRPGDSQGGDPRWGAPPMGAPAGFGQDPRNIDPRYADPRYAGQGYGGQAPGYGGPGYGAPAGGAFGGRGGSFLGTAAAAAAGMIGGSLLLDSLRNMGHAAGGGSHAAFDAGSGGGDNRPAWGNSADSDLARDAGLDDIGGSGGASRSAAAYEDPGPFDQDDTADDDDGGGDFGGGDSDYA